MLQEQKQVQFINISDFAAKAPLLCGGFFQFTINYNSCSHSITLLGYQATMISASTSILSGWTYPYVMTSTAANNEDNEVEVVVAAKGLTLSCGVSRTTSISYPANLSFRTSPSRIFSFSCR